MFESKGVVCAKIGPSQCLHLASVIQLDLDLLFQIHGWNLKGPFLAFPSNAMVELGHLCIYGKCGICKLRKK